MASPQENGKSEANGDVKPTSKVPAWLKENLFEDILKSSVTGYKKIIKFEVLPAMAAGENYATIMLRIEITVELEDGKRKNISYMVKTAHANELFNEMMKIHNIFDVEVRMYLEVVPEMEEMYRDVGIDVKFGAQCYKLNVEENTVVLEDLRPRGFKNANRLEGLDMEHTKCVLKKLAMWHAASATRVETKGKYEDLFGVGFFIEKQKEVMKQFNEVLSKPLMECMKTYQGNEQYLDQVKKLQPNFTDLQFKISKVDPNEFNVLNHGDCWSNNVMFQYDAFGKIKETYLVDYQIPKYGTPAQDLFYFLLSSTKYELKLKQFEYFIKFYYDNLIENLTILKYPKKHPTLSEIHIQLYKYGFWGFATATGVMGAVLLDPTENASLDNFIGETDAGYSFKLLMYSNARYRKHIECILPWLHNRGAMEC